MIKNGVPQPCINMKFIYIFNIYSFIQQTSLSFYFRPSVLKDSYLLKPDNQLLLEKLSCFKNPFIEVQAN